jgi:hypothetical protein
MTPICSSERGRLSEAKAAYDPHRLPPAETGWSASNLRRIDMRRAPAAAASAEQAATERNS